MPTIEDDVKQQLDPATVGQMAKQLGVQNDQVQKAVDVGIPLLLSALTRNASSPEGAQSLSNALARDHDGSVLQNKQAVVQNYQQSDGSGILSHVLGDQEAPVETAISRASGVDAGALLQMLAPIAMGVLGQAQRQQQLGPQDMAGALQANQQQMQQQEGSLLNTVNALLDSNKDGSAIDEVAGMLGSFLNSQQRR
ncbi:MAG TPA: DUF937 domain-containing protein [Chloroflexota bacterium]|nr:DUF937 domain-containing protein [Chloroflexota bacterium]